MKWLMIALMGITIMPVQAGTVDFEGHFLFCAQRSNMDTFLGHMMTGNHKGIKEMGDRGECLLIPNLSVRTEHGLTQPIFNTENLYYQSTTLHHKEKMASGWSLFQGAVHNSGKSE